MRIEYSRSADVLVVRLRDAEIADSRDLAEGVILHVDAQGRPVEVEFLDASKVADLAEVRLAPVALG